MQIVLEQNKCDICDTYALCYCAIILEKGSDSDTLKDVCAKCAHELGKSKEITIICITKALRFSCNIEETLRVLTWEQRKQKEVF